MAHKRPVRTREKTSTSGTGDITVLGVVNPDNLPFSTTMAVADTAYMCVVTGDGIGWEEFLGTYSATNTLTRTTGITNHLGTTAHISLSGSSRVFAIPIASDFEAFINELGAGDTTKFLRGDGTFSVPPGGGGTAAGWHPPVTMATTAALPANTYNNGSSGVGATLTGNSSGALAAIDGITPAVGYRIFVKDEANASHNGIYEVTTVGDGSNPYVLTRASDFDSSSNINQGDVVSVGPYGTINGNRLFDVLIDPAISLDGAVHNATSSGTSVAVSLTTTEPGLVVVHITHDTTSAVSGVASANLTFTRRAIATKSGSNGTIGEVWYATSLSALTSESITVAGSSGGYTVEAFGLAGAGAFDTHSGLPVTATAGENTFGNTDSSTVTGVSSTSAGSFAIFMVGGTLGGSPAFDTGFTDITSRYAPGSGQNIASSYKDFGAALSNETFTFGPQTGNFGSVAIGDVVTGLGAAAGGIVLGGTKFLPHDFPGDFVGDSGSGGVRGMVPAPAAGDAAAGKFLSAGGGYAVPGVSGGAMLLISTLTASSSAALAWTGLTGTHWKLVGNLLRPATSAAQLEIQYGTGAGPTYHTTGYYSGGVFDGVTGSLGPSNLIHSNQAAFLGEAQDNTQLGASFVLDILTDNANWVQMIGHIIYTRSDGTTAVQMIGGVVAISAQLTAIQILESSGNITSGTASLYSISN